jgi:uncharacterized delta-60 repeat protein
VIVRLTVAGLVASLALAATGGATTSGPVVKSVKPASGPPGTTIAISGTGLAGATAVTVGGTPALNVVATAKKVTAMVALGSTTGPVSVTTPGGTATSKNVFTVLPPPVPHISSLSQWTAAIGVPVTIFGTGLLGTSHVSFGGTEAASFDVVSATAIRAVPAPGSTTGPVTVTAPGGIANSALPVTIVSHPLDLDLCAASSGHILMVEGSRVYLERRWLMAGPSYLPQFLKNQSVTLTVGGTKVSKPSGYWDKVGQPAPGGKWQSVFGYDSGKTLTPAGTTMVVSMPGKARAAIDTGLGVIAKGSPLWSPPDCTIVSVGLAHVDGYGPQSGPPGTTVYVTGQNLGSITEVDFGGVSASFGMQGDAIKARVPAGAQSGRITLVEGAAATVETPGDFVVEPAQPLTLDRAVPNAGGVGASVELDGTGLLRVTSVKFGGTAAVVPDTTSDTSLTVTVPAGAHSGQVTVSDGTDTASTDFTVVVPGGFADPSFGTNGSAFVDPAPGLTDQASGIAAQPDGKPIVAGTTNPSNTGLDDGGLALVRLTASGAPDPTFDGDGIMVGPDLHAWFRAAGVAVQADGKIVAAGVIGFGGANLWVGRYLADGSPDPSFGAGGSEVIPITVSGSSCTVTSLGVFPRADGTILLPARACAFPAAVRLLSDGSPDPSYGTNGRAVDSGAGTATPAAATVTSGGKVVLVGAAPPSFGLFVERFDTSGAPDAGFGGSGRVVEPSSSIGAGGAVAVASDGSVFVVGANGSSTTSWITTRLSSDGTTDLAFGTLGFELTSFLGYASGVAPVAAFIIPGGPLAIGSNLLAAYRDDGTPDPAVGYSPLQGISFTPTSNAAALDSSGRLLLTGLPGAADGFPVARFVVQPAVVP